MGFDNLLSELQNFYFFPDLIQTFLLLDAS